MNVQVQPNVTTAIKDYDRAIVDYSDGTKLNPNYVAACNYRAQVHSLKRDFRRSAVPSPVTMRRSRSIGATPRPIPVAGAFMKPSAIKSAQTSTAQPQSDSETNQKTC